MADKVSKGRQFMGSRHHLAKLTEADVKSILQDPRSGPVLAAHYGVNRSVINGIRRGRYWKQVPRPDYLQGVVNSGIR